MSVPAPISIIVTQGHRVKTTLVVITAAASKATRVTVSLVRTLMNAEVIPFFARNMPLVTTLSVHINASVIPAGQVMD